VFLLSDSFINLLIYSLMINNCIVKNYHLSSLLKMTGKIIYIFATDELNCILTTLIWNRIE
jgi:hypothetical protein